MCLLEELAPTVFVCRANPAETGFRSANLGRRKHKQKLANRTHLIDGPVLRAHSMMRVS